MQEIGKEEMVFRVREPPIQEVFIEGPGYQEIVFRVPYVKPANSEKPLKRHFIFRSPNMQTIHVLAPADQAFFTFVGPRIELVQEQESSKPQQTKPQQTKPQQTQPQPTQPQPKKKKKKRRRRHKNDPKAIAQRRSCRARRNEWLRSMEATALSTLEALNLSGEEE
ncbi:hypothetical protein N7456_000443 [Penicillium angulare]|uniref:Uncharacterized protein n=1 Tax=Penicillium angulare TaxID=116970 RepID=A0A9W9GD12_9EURO|nr:hypothetical protein N7456_000443 [Penicillium angulare]